MRVSAPATGMPTVAGLLRIGGLQTCTGTDSVMPNTSDSLLGPMIASMRLRSSPGSGAAPLSAIRNPEKSI